MLAWGILFKMPELIIKQASVENLKELQSLAVQTFYETFSGHNTKENMNIYLDTAFSGKQLKKEMLNPDSYFYLIYDGEQLIGYLKINFNQAQTEIKQDDSAEIERIYVWNTYHGKNIGLLLLNKAIEIAKDNQKGFLWLGVEDKNYRAVKFYQKNGFKQFDQHIFKFGEQMQTDLMMKLDL